MLMMWNIHWQRTLATMNFLESSPVQLYTLIAGVVAIALSLLKVQRFLQGTGLSSANNANQEVKLTTI